MKRGTASTVVAVMLAAAGIAGAAGRGDHVPPAGAWRAAAAHGSALDVIADGTTVRLHVSRNADLAGTPIVDLDGARTGGDVLPLVATVAGDPNGWARITVQGDLVTGYISSARTGGLTLAPARDGSTLVLGRKDIARLLRSAGGTTVIEPGGDAEAAQSCDSLAWTPEVASPTDLVTGTPTRSFDSAFAVDETFVTKHPANWQGLTMSFINVIDGLFRRSFDIKLNAVHLIAIPNSVISATTTDQQLVQLQDYYVATYPSLARENAHLFTGKELTNAAGQVNCVGSAGRTTVSYSVATTVGGPFQFGPLILLPDVATKVGAHELAHTLSDHHHYSNCVEQAPNYNPIYTTDVCTVMINDWGLINMTFSTVDRLTVRGWAQKYNI